MIKRNSLPLALLAAGLSASVSFRPRNRPAEPGHSTTTPWARSLPAFPAKFAIGLSWTLIGDTRWQVAKNEKPIFNLALATGVEAQDLDLSVRLKAVAGEIDQGGGLAWRAADAKNYYLARYNPLEDNFRLYKVVDGVRTQLQTADIQHTAGWHTLRVSMQAAHIQCFYDGRKYLEADDQTFAGTARSASGPRPMPNRSSTI